MTKITVEKVREANRRCILGIKPKDVHTHWDTDAGIMYTTYKGKTYTQKLTREDVKRAYAKALKETEKI